MADIFIAYSREDRTAAKRIDGELRAAGFSTWWDNTLVAGEAWSEKTRAELKSAKCVLVLWSINSWASRWVQAEAHSGFERNALVAARLDDVEIEPPFNIVQIATVYGRKRAEGLRQVIDGAKRKIGTSQRPVRVLLVDDDLAQMDDLHDAFEEFGFDARFAYDGQQAREVLKTFTPDIFILDYSLPDTTGEELLALIRKTSSVPAILITASFAREDEMLDQGFDDFLAKPFKVTSLMARIKAVMRRSQR